MSGLTTYSVHKPVWVMSVRKAIWTLLLLVFAGMVANAEESLRFKHFSVRQGLSDSNVTALAKDSRGFIWIGTKNGLNCFNGYTFKGFRNSPSDPNTIAGNSIQCLYIDSGGNIWAGLLSGRVSRYDPRTETFRNYTCYSPTSEADGDVSAIAEDADGYIWVTVDRRGLVRLNPQTGEVARYEHSPTTPLSLSHNAVTDIQRDSRGKMWITSWGGGLDCFDPVTGSFRHFAYNSSEDLRYRQLKCLHMDHQGNLWIGSTYLGLFFLGTEDEKWEHLPIGGPSGLMGNAVNCISEDSARNIWIGLTNGLSIYNPSDGSFTKIFPTDDEFALHSQMVTCLLPDEDGSMWVGTNSGLHLYNPSLFQFNSLILPGGEIHTDYTEIIVKDSRGRVWLRSGDGLYVIETSSDGSVRKTVLKDSRVDGLGISLFEDSSGNMWVGSHGDLVFKYNVHTLKKEEVRLPIRNVNCFYEDAKGTIWMAMELGLLSYDAGHSRVNPPLFQSGDLIFPSDKSQVVLFDTYGDLWVGTAGGLKRFSEDGVLKRFYTINDDSSLADNDITALCQSLDGSIWVGTASGLCRYDRKADRFSLIRRPEEQSTGYPVMGIAEDRDGQLWITTSNGLVLYDTSSGLSHSFDENDGLPSRVFVRGAICEAADGEILCGTESGAIRFHPEEIAKRHGAPSAYIEDLLISSRRVVPGAEGSPLEKPVWETQQVVLDYQQSTLSFQFSAVEFLSPTNEHFAYRLRGVDTDWQYTGPDNRTATYANLSQGEYVFEVMASDYDGGWSGDIASLAIRIRPPFYLTPWAFVVYFLLMVAMVLTLFFWIRRRNVRKMERIVAAQQHEMDELKLKLFTNVSHEFRTSLTLIMGPLQHLLEKGSGEGRDLMEIMYRSSERLRRLVNQLLDFRKMDAGKMEVHPTTQDLVPFLREVFDTFNYYAGEKHLEYAFHSDTESLVMDFDKDKVDKMVYNLLSNAFKYTDTGGRVTLSLTSGPQEVQISVSDDGIGIAPEDAERLFKRFYQSGDRVAVSRGGSGLGLNMTYELAQLMGGDITVTSEPGKGSIFTITLPVTVSAIPEEEVAAPPEAVHSDETNLPDEREKELILVVEDNPDMQAYFHTVIGGEYHIATAGNGQEGLEKAVDIMPDIIISDVMMPVMDGEQMFRAVKADERISHIPVILLTAIQDEKRVAESLNMGIDDYITKPFSPTILLARISNILRRRKKMWEEKTYDTNPFVVKITGIITENLASPELSLEFLSDKLNMSPSQLTRKTKTLMDITPYSLIIKLRMEQAVRYLKESDYNVSEISFRCGYQEVSNFSRSFTRYWGESPTQYLKKCR